MRMSTANTEPWGRNEKADYDAGHGDIGSAFEAIPERCKSIAGLFLLSNRHFPSVSNPELRSKFTDALVQKLSIEDITQ